MSASGDGPARRRVTVVNAKGIHARPAAMLAARAKGYPCNLALVMVEAPAGEGADPGTRVDAKDVLDIMFLGAPVGATLEVQGEGPGCEQAVHALVALIAAGFEE